MSSQPQYKQVYSHTQKGIDPGFKSLCTDSEWKEYSSAQWKVYKPVEVQQTTPQSSYYFQNTAVDSDHWARRKD